MPVKPKTLSLAKGFSLPLSFTTERIAFLARTGAGKSFASRVLAEELLAAGQCVVIVDPKGDWWGIRSSLDGSSAGFPVLLMGGDHADVPLMADGGRAVAQFVAGEHVSTVLDLSEFGEAEMQRFVAAFGDELYRRNRDAMHLIVDEADEFAPQSGSQSGSLAACIGAMQRLQRRGRGRGIGVTVVTQRSAVLHKSILTQAGTLVAMQTTHPRDLEPIREWLAANASVEIADEMAGSPRRGSAPGLIPQLDTGEAIVCSPRAFDGVKRIKFRMIETFDSMRTPEPGETRREPKTLADVDLAAVERSISDAVERARADDPRELRKTITGLRERIVELEKRPATVETRDVRTFTDEDRADLEHAAARVEMAIEAFRETNERSTVGTLLQRVSDVQTAFETAVERLAEMRALGLDAAAAATPDASARSSAGGSVGGRPTPETAASTAPAKPPSVDRPPTRAAATAADLPKGEASILTAAVQFDGVSREQLGVLLPYKRSTRNAYIQRLREKGFVEDNGTVYATTAGRDALGPVEMLPTGDALRRHWFEALPDGESRVLQHVCKAFPQPFRKDDLEDSTGYSRSTRNAYIQRLRARGLVVNSGSGFVRASDHLFGA
jgi:uncharacterized protein